MSLNKPGKWRFMLSHVQRECGAEATDVAHSLGMTSCWLDVKMKDKSVAAMEEAVANSDFFVCILSDGYFLSEFCRMEMMWALQYKKPIISTYKAGCNVGSVLNEAPQKLSGISQIDSTPLNRQDPEFFDVSMTKITRSISSGGGKLQSMANVVVANLKNKAKASKQISWSDKDGDECGFVIENGKMYQLAENSNGDLAKFPWGKNPAPHIVSMTLVPPLYHVVDSGGGMWNNTLSKKKAPELAHMWQSLAPKLLVWCDKDGDECGFEMENNKMYQVCGENPDGSMKRWYPNGPAHVVQFKIVEQNGVPWYHYTDAKGYRGTNNVSKKHREKLAFMWSFAKTLL